MYQAQLDESLIQQTANGDNKAFKELYETTKSTVYGFALSLLKNKHDAEDIMQETYVKIHQNAAGYEPMGKPLAWILTIVRNLCYNKLGSIRYHEDITEHEAPVHEKGHETAESRMFLEMAMGVLDETERQIVVLHAMTGFKHKEIAEITEIPIATVLSKYNRALKKMKEELNRKGVAIYG